MTMGENLKQVPELKAGQDVVLPMSNPIKSSGAFTGMGMVWTAWRTRRCRVQVSGQRGQRYPTLQYIHTATRVPLLLPSCVCT